MKFSKEYIKECDCPEIQGLRPKMFLCEEYVNRDGVQIQSVDKLSYKTINKPHYRKYLIWLPTGDQLTDLIFKHCHTYNLDITLYHEHHCRDCGKYCIAMEANNANGHLIEKEIDIEAREYEIKLAKIKLLKELLNES